MNYTNRMYVILHPTTALIGSQLNAQELSEHFTVGPTRYYRGKVIFAELDYGFRDDYFNLDTHLVDVRAHEDGRPRATKYIASYRVLEHIDLDALKGLFLTSPEGACLELEPGEYVDSSPAGKYRIYTEIAPLRMLVLSSLGLADFGNYITDKKNPIGAPTFLYAQLDLDLEEFLAEFERNPFMVPPIHNLHPSVLRDAIAELRAAPYKSNKGLSLHSNLDNISYRLIKTGFMFAGRNKTRFYPMPQPSEIEKRNLRFWRSM